MNLWYDRQRVSCIRLRKFWRENLLGGTAMKYERKPEWLKVRLNTNENFHELKRMMRSKTLHTVCEEARCPNIYECWGAHRTATFMILGDICTRACRFCAVKTGLPTELDWQEPDRVAETVAQMGLKHAVVTSVARDRKSTRLNSSHVKISYAVFCLK